jgi:F-type H+-transporting ATPase subunit delta
LKSVSHQYANALADVALAQGASEPALKQLSDFGAAYSTSAELRNFLGSPAVTREAKHAVVEKILARLGASRIIRNFLFLLVDKRRTIELAEIVQAFGEVIRERQGLSEAEIASVTELSAAQKAEFASTLTRLTGKRVELKFRLDPALLGGVVVRVGDTVYDGSLRSRLNAMRARLVGE